MTHINVLEKLQTTVKLKRLAAVLKQDGLDSKDIFERAGIDAKVLVSGTSSHATATDLGTTTSRATGLVTPAATAPHATDLGTSAATTSCASDLGPSAAIAPRDTDLSTPAATGKFSADLCHIVKAPADVDLSAFEPAIPVDDQDDNPQEPLEAEVLAEQQAANAKNDNMER